VGPRFSGKVREEPQRREWEWRGNFETKPLRFTPRTSEPIMGTEKKAEGLSPHPFQPSRREEVKTRGPQRFGNQGQTSWLMKMILPSSLASLLEWHPC
jgi:hypothetical protein